MTLELARVTVNRCDLELAVMALELTQELVETRYAGEFIDAIIRLQGEWHDKRYGDVLVDLHNALNPDEAHV